MKRVWKIVRHPTVATVLVITLLVVSWNVFLMAVAPAKLSDGLSTAVNAGETKLRIAIELGFEPERFHTLKMQNWGNVMKVDGNSVHLRSVDAPDVMQIAKLYWVDSVSLITEVAP